MAYRGYELVAKSLENEGVDTAFFLMGGPMLDAANACIKSGIRLIDVRHEQAAALMAQAYSRLRRRPSVCMAASGPGVINLSTGIANALADCVPVVALGGSAPIVNYQKGAFQEIDQVSVMRPITKWSERVYEAKRIPEYINMALRRASAGRPGPVYLDLPGDVLYNQPVEEDEIQWPRPLKDAEFSRPAAAPDAIRAVLTKLEKAERPVIVTGSGIIYSQAEEALRTVIERMQIPFFTTPQGRGVVPEDHALAFPGMRSSALRKADVVLVVGTRLNYIFGYGKPPRFAEGACIIRVDIDPAEIDGTGNADIGIVADARAFLEQMAEASSERRAATGGETWVERLRRENEAKRPAVEAKLSTDASPIHPLRLCKEIRDVMDRDAVLVVDGQEILNFARQSIPTHHSGHRLNSGVLGTMGVGLPLGVGAKAAMPDKQVIVLHGDGSFGMNCMELDTAVRHNLPLLVVISLNGGWTADPDERKPGRKLAYTRYEQLAEVLGCHGEFVKEAEDIRPALERAIEQVRQGKVAVVNVETDWRAGAKTLDFTAYKT
jgi:acetolactate synthase-1/2/3 large subunit